MICLVCGERMKKIVTLGVELDHCPGCEGVWLERGELEKVIAFVDHSRPEAVSPPQADSHPPKVRDGRPRPEHQDLSLHYHHDDEDNDGEHYPRYSGERGCYDQHGQHDGHDRKHGRPCKHKLRLPEILNSYGD